MTQRSALLRVAIAACVFSLAARPVRAAEIWLGSTRDSVHKSQSGAARQLVRELTADIARETGICIKVLAAEDRETRTAAESLALALEDTGRQATLGDASDQSPGTWVVIQVATRTLGTRHQIEIFCSEKRYTAFHLGKDWIDGHIDGRDPAYAWFRVCSDWSFDADQASVAAQQQLTRELQREIAPDGHADCKPSVPPIPCLLADTRVRSDEHVEEKVRPYGTQYRRHLLIGVPQPLLVEWKSALAWNLWKDRAKLALATLLASLVLAAAIWAAYRLDRLTRGYRRSHLAVGLFGTLILLAWLWRMVVA